MHQSSVPFPSLVSLVADPPSFSQAIKVVKRNNPRANRLRELRRQQSTFPPSDHTPLTARVSSTETKIRKEIAIMKKCRHANVVMLVEVIDDPISERIFMGNVPPLPFYSPCPL
jgi:hypothetical protein